MTLWVDASGFPAIVQYTMRVVPPDTAVALKNKQINVTFKLSLSNINQPVQIDAPSGAKPIADLMKDEVQAQTKARCRLIKRRLQ